MIKIKTFTGKEGNISWNGTVSNSASSKLNRWIESIDHDYMDIKSINCIDNKTITVVYSCEDGFIETPKYFEEGFYIVNTTTGKVMSISDEVDISYMVNDFEELKKLRFYDHERLFIMEAINGKLITKRGLSCKVYQSDGGPISYTKDTFRSTSIENVINIIYLPKTYLMSLDSRVDTSYKFENGTKFYLNLKNETLIDANNQLDISYTVKYFHDFNCRLSDLLKHRYGLTLDDISLENGDINIEYKDGSFKILGFDIYSISAYDLVEDIFIR